jgi:signal transduction histidine kinase
VAMVNAVIRGYRFAAWTVICVLYVSDLTLSLVRDLGRDNTWQNWLAVGAVLGLVLVAGDIARTTTEAGLSARRAMAEERRRQASDERLRMARELHDVLAHNISLINVQAGVALHLMDGDPEQARTALTAIKRASKDTLGELRAALGVLRGDGDDAAPRSPTPGLAQLPELIEQVRAAGHPVVTDLADLPELPAPVQLAAFRVVQEALTNVRRHAGTATATVTMRYDGGELTVRVDDDGRTGAGTGTQHGTEQGAGSGIAGMRERATALGGTLHAAHRPDGGFRVEARLPAPAARMDP